MTPETILALIQLTATLASNVLGKKIPTGDIQNVQALQALAAAVAKGYQDETGQPIDALKFIFEAPLEPQ